MFIDHNQSIADNYCYHFFVVIVNVAFLLLLMMMATLYNAIFLCVCVCMCARVCVCVNANPFVLLRPNNAKNAQTNHKHNLIPSHWNVPYTFSWIQCSMLC